jgi:hypothetical protein
MKKLKNNSLRPRGSQYELDEKNMNYHELELELAQHATYGLMIRHSSLRMFHQFRLILAAVMSDRIHENSLIHAHFL